METTLSFPEFAGSLAESGVTQLQIQQPGRSPELHHARVTDLPGLLAALPDESTLRWEIPTPGSAIIRAGHVLLSHA